MAMQLRHTKTNFTVLLLKFIKPNLASTLLKNSDISHIFQQNINNICKHKKKERPQHPVAAFHPCIKAYEKVLSSHLWHYLSLVLRFH